MKFFHTVWRAGTATIILYGGLAICLAALLINTFYPIPSSFIDSTVGIFTLILLADLLYLKLEEKTPGSTVDKDLLEAGILRILPRMDGDLYKNLMSKPGKKIILNTWIYNFSDLSPLLNEAIQHSNTTIHFTLLNPDCKHATIRGDELSNKNIIQTINSNLNEIAIFYSMISEEQRKRVKIFLYDGAPKLSIYACGNKALVGMFLPKSYAVHATQFFIDGREGHFSHNNVWDYYDSLKKEDITESLLSRVS